MHPEIFHFREKILAVHIPGAKEENKEECRRKLGLLEDVATGKKDDQRRSYLVYVTPEKLKDSAWLKSSLIYAASHDRLALIVVDECHCLATYGRNFRQAFKVVKILREADWAKGVPFLGTTATADSLVLSFHVSTCNNIS